MRRSIALLPALAAALVLMSQPSFGQATWSGNGSPVFGSDARKSAEQLEAERAERRKTYGPTVYPKFMQGGERPAIKPAAPPIVYFNQAEEVGSIIVDTQNRKLYFVLPDKKAYEYPISVGRDGFTWAGTEKISRVAEWPSWTPPPEMHKRVPGLPITVTGGMLNPQGARALYLGSTIYRIHGTNNDRSVGRANSSGCFRLTNENVIHLASIARVGTKVKVLQAYGGGVSQSAPLSSMFGFLGTEEPPKLAAKPKTPPKRVAKKVAPAAEPVPAPPAVATAPASVPAAPASVTAGAE
jgi:lipoprotein-anchoring transpeptidase ErfK/SrfK